MAWRRWKQHRLCPGIIGKLTSAIPSFGEQRCRHEISQPHDAVLALAESEFTRLILQNVDQSAWVLRIIHQDQKSTLVALPNNTLFT